jgi:hypothetical protein
MSKVFGVFADATGEFSWRKIMTAGCLLVFMIAQIGYIIEHDFDEMPTAYWAVDAGVFSFYFLKETLQNIRIGNKETNTNKPTA